MTPAWQAGRDLESVDKSRYLCFCPSLGKDALIKRYSFFVNLDISVTVLTEVSHLNTEEEKDLNNYFLNPQRTMVDN